MAIDATELGTLRDALVRARAQGLRAVEYDGRKVEYRSDAEMAAAIASLDGQIAQAVGRRPAVVTFRTSKGV